jgi:hypothetical protein
MAHGGSLTINPHTGLPEASFLSGMLPMILGAGLAAATGGSSLLIGAGIGGLQAARTGSIGKGLMAGLGAFGGAGLATGLMGAGAANMAGGLAGASPAELAAAKAGAVASPVSAIGSGITGLGTEAGRSALVSQLGGGMGAAQTIGAAALPALIGDQKAPTMATPDKDMGQRYSFTGNQPQATPAPDVPTYEDMLTKQGNFGRQQNYFATPTYTPINPSQAKDLYHFAAGGPVEMMSNNAAIGANTMYPMANMTTSAFATPYQTPQSTNMVQNMAPSGGGTVNMMSGEPNMQGTRLAEGGEANEDFLASVARAFGKGPKKEDPGPKYTYGPEQQQYQQMATGGLSDAGYNLGGYSDGGRLLRGPGDGVSDSIPASIGHKQPARLADGEFVVPARIVSELGNGSTEAGARKLYAMMDRVQAARKKTIGKDKVAHNSKAEKYLPA